MVHTQRDIAYDVGIVSRYMVRPTVMHWNTVKRIMRSLKGTLSYGLLYSARSNNNMLSGYSDSDFAEEVDDRKSTGGTVFYQNDSVITWVSQKQRWVDLSSCEAEFMAATTAACQGIVLRNLLGKITNEKIGLVLQGKENVPENR